MELFAIMDDTLVGFLDKELDLSHAKVAEMKRNLHSPYQRREAYLDLYATGHPCPNWRQVAKALRGVGLHHQARTVESTYVQGTRIIPMHPLSVTVIVRFVMAKHNSGTFPVTLLIIVCVNLKAGAATVCLGVGVYLCTFHIINSRCMREGYGSHCVCVCVCVCVCLSVTTQTATYLVCESKSQCYKVPYGDPNS